MSGVAAIARSGGRPIDRQLLEAMTRCLLSRGPDGQQSWSSGSFGLGHGLFRTTEESPHKQQPLSLDGQVWISADARIDARPDLIRKLHGRGPKVSPAATDAEVILHAYHAWGKDCLNHLLGDFAFVIADTRQRRIFAARDHLGVKPLFYAAGDDCLCVSSMLDCVRLSPTVSDTLNDLFLCDFLMHGWNAEVTATAFRDVHRLAPAHSLEWSNEGLRMERYWSLEVPDEVRHPRQQDYVDQFMEAFEAAIEDRLRTDRVVISMSGGLDSSALAATTMPLAKRRSRQTELKAVTAVYDRIIPDRERYYASLVAERIGIAVDFVAGDDLEFYDSFWDSPEGQTPEPSVRHFPLARNLLEHAAGHARVVLSGEGGDEAISLSSSYYQKLLKEHRFRRFCQDLLAHFRTPTSHPLLRVVPKLYRGVLARLQTQPDSFPTFPTWIHPDLVRQNNLLQRWESFWNQSRKLDSRTPAGMSALSGCMMPHLIEFNDQLALRGPVEYRYPFFDLRVIRASWSIPPIPYRCRKQLLRAAMSDQLPRVILRRPKEGLAGDPLTAKGHSFPNTWEECVRRTPELAFYVVSDPHGVGKCQTQTIDSAWANARPYELASWLAHVRPSRVTRRCTRKI